MPSHMNIIRISFVICNYEIEQNYNKYQPRKTTLIDLDSYFKQSIGIIFKILRYAHRKYEGLYGSQVLVLWNCTLTSPNGQYNIHLNKWNRITQKTLSEIFKFFNKIRLKDIRETNPTIADDQLKCLPISLRNCLMHCGWNEQIMVTPFKSTGERLTEENNFIVFVGGLTKNLPQTEDEIFNVLLSTPYSNQRTIKEMLSTLKSKKITLSAVVVHNASKYGLLDIQTNESLIKKVFARITPYGLYTSFSKTTADKDMRGSSNLRNNCKLFKLIYLPSDNFQNEPEYAILKINGKIDCCINGQSCVIDIRPFRNSSNRKCSVQQQQKSDKKFNNNELINSYHTFNTGQQNDVINDETILSSPKANKDLTESDQMNNELIIENAIYVNQDTFSNKSFKTFAIGDLKTNNRKCILGQVFIDSHKYYVLIRALSGKSIVDLSICHLKNQNLMPDEFVDNNGKEWSVPEMKTVDQDQFNAIQSEPDNRKLHDIWRNDLGDVVTPRRINAVDQQALQIDEKSNQDFFECSKEEAQYVYIEHLRSILDLSKNNTFHVVSDYVQRALLTGQITLSSFLNNSEMWLKQTQYLEAKAHMRRMLADKLKQDEIEEAIEKNLGKAILFQLEAALILGQFLNSKSPKSRALTQDELNLSNEDEIEDIFEIANFIRWAMSFSESIGGLAMRILEQRHKSKCKFATKVYRELRYDYTSEDELSNDESAKEEVGENQPPPIEELTNEKPIEKRKRQPLTEIVEDDVQRKKVSRLDSAKRKMVSEYKMYAKRVVDLSTEEWASKNDDCFVAESPEAASSNSTPNYQVFCIPETPDKSSTNQRLESEEIAMKRMKSKERRLLKIARYKAKIKKIEQSQPHLKHPNIRHALYGKELKYHRKLKVLLNTNNVCRQLFPQEGVWYSSESNSSSSLSD